MTPYEPVIERDKVDGGWTAWCPETPGCVSDGATPREATHNWYLALDAWLEARETSEILDSLSPPQAPAVPTEAPQPGVPTMNLLETCDGPGGPPWRLRQTVPEVLGEWNRPVVEWGFRDGEDDRRGGRPKFLHNVISHPLLWLWPRVGWWIHDRTEPE